MLRDEVVTVEEGSYSKMTTPVSKDIVVRQGEPGLVAAVGEQAWPLLTVMRPAPASRLIGAALLE